MENKVSDWSKVKVMIMGKEVAGIKSLRIEETGLTVDNNGELQREIKIYNAETDEEI